MVCYGEVGGEGGSSADYYRAKKLILHYLIFFKRYLLVRSRGANIVVFNRLSYITISVPSRLLYSLITIIYSN